MDALCPSVSLNTIFTDDELRTGPSDALLARLLAPTRAADVESVWMSTNVQISSEAGAGRAPPDFGRPIHIPTGEMLYVRIRSSIKTTFFKPRAECPLHADETREITCLIVAGAHSAANVGVFNQLIAIHRPTWWPTLCHGDRTNTRVVDPSAVYGSNIVPFVFLSHYYPRKRGLFAVMSHAAVLTGSVTFLDGACSAMKGQFAGSALLIERAAVAMNRVQRGLAVLTVAEWIANMPRLEERDASLITVMTQAQHAIEKTKAQTRINRAFAQQRDSEAHGTNALPKETCADFADAFGLTQILLEFGTLAGIVDRIACGAFDGVLVKALEMPRCFPLYLCACTLLATYLPCDLATSHEDRAAAESIVGVVHTLTAREHIPTGVRSTSLAALVDAAVSEVSSEERDHPPAMELMRRQGSALLQEIGGLYPAKADECAHDAARELMGSERFIAARARVGQSNADFARAKVRASGITGNVSCHKVREQRVSTRAQMQRVVVATMLDMNTYCATGFFRGRRYAPSNTTTEDRIFLARGVALNRAVAPAVITSLAEFFVEGSRALIPHGIPFIFPLRPRTRTTCPGCNEAFDPRSCVARGLLSGCMACKRRFCTTCYASMARTLVAASGSKVPSDGFVQQNTALLECKGCRASPKRGNK